MAENQQDQSWQIALTIAKKVGYIPIAFAQAIRMLASDHLKNKGQIRSVTKYQISRLFRGDSFKSTIYFASKELAEDYLSKTKACTIGDLVAQYSPLDLAAFITCFFLNRRMKKIGGETWKLVAPHFATEASVGALVGVAIPKLGYAPGLLLSALRNVSLALMCLEKPQEFKEYRAKLEASKKIVDENLERQLWKTTSAQVSSMVLTTLGYMTEIADIISSAVNTNQRADEIKNENLKLFRLAYIWNEAFLLDREQPAEKLASIHYPLKQDRNKATPHMQAALAGEKAWLDRGKEDLNPQKAPQLFTKIVTNDEFEIPDELKDVFNLEELTSMDENDFDALIDQIDAEQKAGSKRDDVISTKDLAELEKQCE